jgi:hypothetical protein
LKVLTDREVSPQLGLLKSTLLQLDSTFTERDFGASTFRDFIEKMASAGYVNLKQVDRSLLVELKDGATAEDEEPQPQPAAEPMPAMAAASAPPPAYTPPPGGPSPSQVEDGVRALFDAFQNAKNPPHWPMYLRNVRQYVKNAAPAYDERRYGFANFLEAVRAAGRAGLFRLERNRQGILRIFAGNQFPRPVPVPIFDIENELAAAEPVAEVTTVAEEAAPVVEEPTPVVAEEVLTIEEIPEEEEPKPASVKRRTRAPASSAKKKPTTARKAKKKTAGDSEGS